MPVNRRVWDSILTLSLVVVRAMGAEGHFTADERDFIVRFWAKPGRYEISLPENAPKVGIWQMRLSPEGSVWLWNYNKARGLGKVPPGQIPAPQNAEQAVWEDWINRKVAHDRWAAQTAADSKNRDLGLTVESLAGAEPPAPGNVPTGLAKLCGAPPAFASAVKPMQYAVTFVEGERYVYVDNVAMRPRYAYYRFSQGVNKGGTQVKKLPQEALDALCRKAGISESEQRVMKAVSLLEGGFESINTYDTGFLSVGFIQFATLKEGGGSLGEVLLQFKSDFPQDFNVDFRRFGIDVDETGKLVAMNPVSGDEKVGSEAVALIIDDKRLTAVFQRAGATSENFKIEQLKVAKQRFYPSEDVLTVMLNGKPTQVKVCQIVRSEAGLATLFDRKVNTGNIRVLGSICERICAEQGLDSIEDLASCEYDIIRAMTYRTNFLSSADLTLPRLNGSSASRSGKRKSNAPPPKKR